MLRESIFLPSPDSKIVLQTEKGLGNTLSRQVDEGIFYQNIRMPTSARRATRTIQNIQTWRGGVSYDSTVTQRTCYQNCALPLGTNHPFDTIISCEGGTNECLVSIATRTQPRSTEGPLAMDRRPTSTSTSEAKDRHESRARGGQCVCQWRLLCVQPGANTVHTDQQFATNQGASGDGSLLCQAKKIEPRAPDTNRANPQRVASTDATGVGVT
jgi:hypothetical protein